MEEWVRRFGASLPMCMTASWFKVLGPTGYKVVARLNRARKRAPLRLSSRPHHRTRSYQDEAWRDQTRKSTIEKNTSPCLTQKAPYKGRGADSEEKREPASDIDTATVDSLKALDPERPIREADINDRPLAYLVSVKALENLNLPDRSYTVERRRLMAHVRRAL